MHECVPLAELDAAVAKACARLALAGPEALARSKKLLLRVQGAAITPQLGNETAAALAETRAGGGGARRHPFVPGEAQAEPGSSRGGFDARLLQIFRHGEQEQLSVLHQLRVAKRT